MPSLLVFRRALAYALGDLGIFGVAAATNTTVALFLQSSTDANASTNTYNRAWLYVSTGASAGQSRRVAHNGWAPSTGIATLESQWNSNPVNSDNIELTRLFPATGDIGTDTDYRTLINRALSHLATPDRVALSIVAGQDAYALPATWGTWMTEERLKRVLEPPPLAGRNPRDAMWRRPKLRLDAELPYLELGVPFTASVGSLTLEVLRPADTWIRSGTTGVWGESTTTSGYFSGVSGLVHDNDEARASVEDVTTVGLMLATEVLMKRTVDRPSGDWEKMHAEAKADAMSLTHFDQTRYRQQQAEAPAQPGAVAA